MHKKSKMTLNDAERIVMETMDFINMAKVNIEISLNALMDEEEKGSIFLKTEFNPLKMLFIVSLYNSRTRTITLKIYEVAKMINEAQAGFFQEAMKLDTYKLYDTSKKRFYKEDTIVSVS